MTCKELIDFLDDYVSGELPAPQAALFERHLTHCPSCRADLDSYRATVALARSTHPPNPPTLPPELLTAILAAVARNTDH